MKDAQPTPLIPSFFRHHSMIQVVITFKVPNFKLPQLVLFLGFEDEGSIKMISMTLLCYLSKVLKI